MSVFKRGLMWLFRIFCLVLPVSKNKIVVSNYYGRGYGDNAKYIVSELLRDKKQKKIVWLTSNEGEALTLPDGVDSCQYNSFAAIFHLSTARVWLDNCRKGFWHKKRSQRYIQTWHGFALKKIEKDAVAVLGSDYEKNATRDSSQIDLIVSDSDFMSQIYKNSFWYDGEVVKWGSPRNDILVRPNSDIKKNVKAFFNLDDDTKIILYAPTFRADKSTTAYSMDYLSVIEKCNHVFSGNHALLLRMHPNIINKCSEVIGLNNAIINATLYPDMQELLASADIVISDYSSLMFDFAITKGPCFIFATDIDEYKKDRNFYYDIKSTPFPVAETNEELFENIMSFDNDTYKKGIDEFFKEKSITADGQASLMCSNWILGQIK